MWNDFIATVGPPFFTLLGLVATAAVAMGTNYVRKNWLNNVAQDAFSNAAGGIVNELGEELLKTVLSPSHPSVAAAVAKVQDRVPTAVKTLGLQPADIAERIVDAVGKLQAPAIGSLLPPPIAAIAGAVAQGVNHPAVSPAKPASK